jgi:hypothetical protein
MSINALDKRDHSFLFLGGPLMRVLLAVLMVAGIALGFTGCSDKIKLDPAKTVAYDKERDGEPKDMGGPAVGKGKGKGGGNMAPPPIERP